MKLTDSRRLTGPNLLLSGAGAVVEVELDGEDVARLVASWQTHARKILEAVGWPQAELAHRTHRGGLTLALSAPGDALYAATEINEWALAAAQADLDGEKPPDLDDAAARLRAEIDAESNPSLMSLVRSAAEHDVSCLSDDDHVSVGLGTGSITWPARQVPAPDQIDWQRVHDIPVALVTGTNGKSTTVRLLASIVDAAGKAAGLCSTDWIRVGDQIVEKGDYSGPGGARQVLRHPSVEVAVLETARGGILRRGLALERAAVALVTNVAEDHLGESGIYDLDQLAQAKLVVHKAAKHLVLNADDPILVRHGLKLGQPITWFSLDADNEIVQRHRARGGDACRLVGRQIVVDHGPNTRPVLSVESIPITLGGAARHNVANALGAVSVARALGLPVDAVRHGLSSFESNPQENPGRLNLFRLGRVTAIVDFAHNPHGVAALLETASAMPARRRLVSTGQAGDRDDDSIRELAATIARARPDRVIVKELEEYLRGRAPGEVPALIIDQLQKDGLSPEAIGRADSEMDAIRQALAWARNGDLLLLITHSQRSGVISFLERLQNTGWSAGDPVPGQEPA
jgi:UDP-N-acetylmuramyl tripeptide synthase